MQRVRTLSFWKRNLVAITGSVLMALGVCYIGAPRLNASVTQWQGQRQNKAALVQAQTQTQPMPTYAYVFGQPTGLSLPRLSISLQVEQGSDGGASRGWTLDRTHAFVMTGSRTPATPIIYGHAIQAVFGRLVGVATDEQLYVTMSDGRSLLYRYVDDLVVSPQDGSILSAQYDHSILLMTCTGPTFQNRRVLHFEFVGEVQRVTYQKGSHGYFA